MQVVKCKECGEWNEAGSTCSCRPSSVESHCSAAGCGEQGDRERLPNEVRDVQPALPADWLNAQADEAEKGYKGLHWQHHQCYYLDGYTAALRQAAKQAKSERWTRTP